jgi:hypothetical protein
MNSLVMKKYSTMHRSLLLDQALLIALNLQLALRSLLLDQALLIALSLQLALLLPLDLLLLQSKPRNAHPAERPTISIISTSVVPRFSP